MIDLMFPLYLTAYNPYEKAGVNNPGGGMSTKLLSVMNVLSQRYLVNVVESFDAVSSGILVIEPLTPRMLNLDIDVWLQELRAVNAKKVLYCSEMEVVRWSPNTLLEVLDCVDVVTANTAYQKQIIWALSKGECYPLRLCDPIDDTLFRPGQVKAPRVFSAGRVSKDKNSDFLATAFSEIKSLMGEGVETAYYGSATLWGEAEPEEIGIEHKLADTVDVYRAGMPRNELASLFGESLIYLAKSKHDVYSSTHVECLASGCVTVAGGHPLYAERPGIAGLDTAKDFAKAVQELLDAEDQLETLCEDSRNYVIQHCGFSAFLSQFNAVLEVLL